MKGAFVFIVADFTPQLLPCYWLAIEKKIAGETKFWQIDRMTVLQANNNYTII